MNVSISTPNVETNLLNAKRFVLTTAILLVFSAMHAQRFSVQRFRQLPNDISAYIQPVKDLNDEACALIKIVGSRDFVFSTPLGVVKRKNDVGETWIYVPRGTTQITIKHPQWGVLRDYRFPSPLESRLTYELVLNAPVTMPRKRIPPIENTAVSYLRTYELPLQQLPTPEWQRPRRPKEKAAWLIIPSIGFHRQEVAGGIRLAWMRRHGIYLHVLSDFRTTPTPTDKNVTRTGYYQVAIYRPTTPERLKSHTTLSPQEGYIVSSVTSAFTKASATEHARLSGKRTKGLTCATAIIHPKDSPLKRVPCCDYKSLLFPSVPSPQTENTGW